MRKLKKPNRKTSAKTKDLAQAEAVSVVARILEATASTEAVSKRVANAADTANAITRMGSTATTRRNPIARSTKTHGSTSTNSTRDPSTTTLLSQPRPKSQHYQPRNN
jgi:hypothetical protein